MYPIEVTYEGGDRFLVRARQHRFLVDQPVEDGGEDHGPTPTELFVAGLAACVGFYAERFLRRHNLPVRGLGVGCDYTMSDNRPARVSAVRITVSLPEPLPDRMRAPFERVIDRCTLHNTLRHPPHMSIAIAEPVMAR